MAFLTQNLSTEVDILFIRSQLQVNPVHYTEVT